jgi:hypothetical protein
MSNASTTSTEKSSKRLSVPHLGRSPLTGEFVLKPVTKKGGKITQKQANNAVKLILVKKK